MTQIITYSPAYTLVPTYECFNACSYCNFRVQPGTDNWLTIDQARHKLKGLHAIEILLLSGEVHSQSPRRTEWFNRIYGLCQLVLTEGFLPHTNAGPLSFEEMTKLRQVNVSMGLMLEQLAPSLLKGVHRYAPSKQPKIRLEQLNWAGQLKIPFTTGLLLGIGERIVDWEATLAEIANLHRQYGHIQEVILQPYQPGVQQLQLAPHCDDRSLLHAVQIARRILPTDIILQIPPNLVRSPEMLTACLDAGVRDLGGIGPVDEVNPMYAHQPLAALKKLLHNHGYDLRPRLPIYPKYDGWLPAALYKKVQLWRTTLDLKSIQFSTED